jgi:hypothetical protein
LKKHREKNLERYITYENQVKEIVQELISSLSYELKKRTGNTEKNRFKVFNTDYVGIRIVRGQGLFRKFYEVEISNND